METILPIIQFSTLHSVYEVTMFSNDVPFCSENRLY